MKYNKFDNQGMNTHLHLRTICGAALGLVYPGSLYCISCGKIIDDSRTYRLCNDCMAAMNWITDRHCRKCGRPMAATDHGRLCFSCKEREYSSEPHSFDRGYSCAGYGTCEKSMIFALKYGGRSDIADTIAEIMYDRMLAEYEADELAGMYSMIIPVPIFSRKKKLRGFNQAGLIAKGFSKRSGIRLEPDIVIRTRDTKPMKGLHYGERKANIYGAFEVRRRKRPLIAGSEILIIDDIMTSGSTLDEIAALLKSPQDDGNGERMPGASRVDFLSFTGGADILS